MIASSPERHAAITLAIGYGAKGIQPVTQECMRIILAALLRSAALMIGVLITVRFGGL